MRFFRELNLFRGREVGVARVTLEPLAWRILRQETRSAEFSSRSVRIDLPYLRLTRQLSDLPTSFRSISSLPFLNPPLTSPSLSSLRIYPSSQLWTAPEAAPPPSQLPREPTQEETSEHLLSLQSERGTRRCFEDPLLLYLLDSIEELQLRSGLRLSLLRRESALLYSMFFSLRFAIGESRKDSS